MSDETSGLEWAHKVVDIRERKRFKRTANAHECAALTAIFGEAVCRALSANYEIRPLAPGRYRMTGAIDAVIEQTCGVTLDPVEQHIAETIDVEFRAGRRHDAALEPDFDALEGDDPEPIEHGEIRAGRLIGEVVASAIDPFPRGEDAGLEHAEAGDAEPRQSPFAALRQLQPRGKSG